MLRNKAIERYRKISQRLFRLLKNTNVIFCNSFSYEKEEENNLRKK